MLGKNETRNREGRKEEKSIMQSCKLCGEKIKLIGSYAFGLYSGVSSVLGEHLVLTAATVMSSFACP